MKRVPVGDSANLDVLRAIAVLYVVVGHTLGAFPALHFSQRPWLGRLGVLFFFVHTCLVLMRSLERSALTLSWKSLFPHFYTRRAFRIYPLSILFVAGVVWFDFRAVRGFEGMENYTLTQRDIASNFLLTQNLTFSPNVMGVLWSLPIEVQMYILLPPLFLFVTRVPSVWALVALWAFSIPLAVVQPRLIARADLAQYIPNFLPGVIAYLLTRNYKPRVSHHWWIPALLAISATFLMAPGRHAGWLVCLLLGFLIPCFHDVPDGFVRRTGAVIAKYSYGLYLWHTIAIVFAFQMFAAPFLLQLAVFLVILAAVPVALFHRIEHPLMKFGVKVADKFFVRAPLRTEPIARAAATNGR